MLDVVCAHTWDSRVRVSVPQSIVGAVSTSGYPCAIVCGCWCTIVPSWADCTCAALLVVSCFVMRFACCGSVDTNQCRLGVVDFFIATCACPSNFVNSFSSLVCRRWSGMDRLGNGGGGSGGA